MRALLLTVLLAVPLVAQGQYDETDIRLSQEEFRLNAQSYWNQSIQAQERQARALEQINRRLRRQAEAQEDTDPWFRNKSRFNHDDDNDLGSDGCPFSWCDSSALD